MIACSAHPAAARTFPRPHPDNWGLAAIQQPRPIAIGLGDEKRDPSFRVRPDNRIFIASAALTPETRGLGYCETPEHSGGRGPGTSTEQFPSPPTLSLRLRRGKDDGIQQNMPPRPQRTTALSRDLRTPSDNWLSKARLVTQTIARASSAAMEVSGRVDGRMHDGDVRYPRKPTPC
jgi:hypothetical protein